MKLIIVRHGETSWNRHMRLQGQRDILISRNGLKQAKILAKRLSKVEIEIIYTSKLKRAIKTAEEIRKYHKNSKFVRSKSLNEMSWGIWEGLKMSYIKTRYKSLYKKREKNKFNFKVPKGESPKQLKDRLRKILDEIIKQNKDKTALIVGHGGVNRILLGILLGWNNEKIMSVRLHNASVTMLNVKNNKIKMLLFDSKRHLENGNMQS